MTIKIISIFLKKSSFYISLLSLFLNKESKKAIKYSVFQALYKISCYFIILIIVLKFLSIFYLSARATSSAPATYQAAGLASQDAFIAKFSDSSMQRQLFHYLLYLQKIVGMKLSKVVFSLLKVMAIYSIGISKFLPNCQMEISKKYL